MNIKLIKYGLGILAGAALGFSYWYFVGCNSGTCAITSSPVNSSIYGAVMGGLVLNMFSTKKEKEA
jgi:hypothetical protein